MIKTCANCGKTFESKKNKQRFCSVQCRASSTIKRNDIILKENYAELIIESKTYEQKVFLIDIEDVEKIQKYTWRLYYRKGANFYAVAHLNKNDNIRLHRYITNCPSDLVVDHINHNTLDNRKCNLRVCSQRANTLNATLSKNNTTGFNGIQKVNNKWIVFYCNKYVGIYKDINQTKEARLNAEQKDIDHLNYKD